jgi:hypothetical protein
MFKMCAQIYDHPTSVQSDGPQKIPDPPDHSAFNGGGGGGGGGSDMMLNNVPRSTADLASPRSTVNKESLDPPPPLTVLPLTEGGGGPE